MLKSMLAAGAFLAATTVVAHVGFTTAGVTVGGKTVTGSTLQLRDAGEFHVLASSDKVEPLGGVVEVSLDGGRVVTLEPGIRIARAGERFEISSHGGRPMRITCGDSTISVASPAALSPADGGWTLGDNTRLAGSSLRASLVSAEDPTRVAEADGGTPPVTPPAEGTVKTVNNVQFRFLNGQWFGPGNAAADADALLHLNNVSPIGG